MSSREEERSVLRESASPDVAIELSAASATDSPLEAVRASMQQRADQVARMGAEAERAQSDSAAVVSEQQRFQPLPHSSTAIDVAPSSAAAAAVKPPPLSLGNALARWIPKRVLGISYLALSAMIFSVMALFVSMLSKSLPSFQIVWARCILQFVCGYLSCRFYGIDFLGPAAKRRWLSVRGGVGVVAFSLYYFAIANLTLADATTIFFTAPLYTGMLGFIFLGEKVHRADVALTLASVLGVVLVVRPAAIFGSTSSSTDDSSSYSAADGDSGSGATTNATTLRTWGILSAIGGSLMSAFVYIAIRKVGPGVNPLVLVCYMGGVGMFMAPFGALLQTFVWPTFTAWVLIAAVGFFSFTGQILFNAGVQMEKAGPASMIRNLDVAMSFVWQMTIEGIAPNVWSVVGAIVISASVVTMGVRKWLADERAEHTKLLTHSGAVPAADKLVRVDASASASAGASARAYEEHTSDSQLSGDVDQQAAVELSDVDLQQPTLARWHSGASS